MLRPVLSRFCKRTVVFTRSRRGCGWALLAWLALSPALALADPVWDELPFTPFSEMQGVDAAGYTTWRIPTSGPDDQPGYRLRGVVLNSPAQMLDGGAAYAEGPMFFMGGQWQVFIQAVSLPDDATHCPELLGDRGGAALWIGQNYGNHKFHYPDWSYNYTDTQWEAEVDRLNHPIDVATGQPVTEPLRPGDLVEVRARTGLEFGGKFNCNEAHDNDPGKDFDLYLLARDLPVEPASITLDDVMDATGAFLFDPTRATGAESYQAQYVTLRGVTIANPGSWTTDSRTLTVTDGVGDPDRTLTIWLGHEDPSNPTFSRTNVPTGTIDITGIFNQEAGQGDPRKAYSLWAMDPWAFVPSGDPLPGDADNDGAVTAADAAILAAHWLQPAGATWFDGDFNGDRTVDDLDASILAAHWSYGGATSAVPEPSAAVLTLVTLAALLLRGVPPRASKPQ